jgi:hypothetical protein
VATTSLSIAFISYSRADSEFALKLAGDLKAAGANVWLDQLDIEPGTHWDTAVEEALLNSAHLLVLLSSVSVKSDNVRDEVSYALSQQMKIIPVLVSECKVPFRLARFQHIDFRKDYAAALSSLLKTLRVEQRAIPPPAVWRTSQNSISATAERKRRVEAAHQQQLAQQPKEQEERGKAEASPPAADEQTMSAATSERPEHKHTPEHLRDLSPSDVAWLSRKPARGEQPEIRKPEPSIRVNPLWAQIARYAIVYGTVNAIAALILDNPHGVFLTILFQLTLGVISGVILAGILRRFKPELARKSLRSIIQAWLLSAVVFLLLYWLTLIIWDTLLDHPWLSLGLYPRLFIAVVSQAIAGAATGWILGAALQRPRRPAMMVGLISFAVPALLYHWFARAVHIDMSPVDFMFRFFISVIQAALFLWLIRDWGKLPSESSAPEL